MPRLPPPTVRSAGVSRITSGHSVRFSVVPEKSSSPGQPPTGGYASILTVATPERPPASVTVSFAVRIPAVVYV